MNRDLYFASPLFCESEKRYNLKLTRKIEDMGYTVFLPQRNGFEFVKLKNMSSDEKGQLIHHTDRDRVRQSEVIVAVLDGRVPDEGVITEITWAMDHRDYTGFRNHVVGLKTDVRLELPDSEDGLNPLVRWNLDTIVFSRKDLFSHLRNLPTEATGGYETPLYTSEMNLSS